MGKDWKPVPPEILKAIREKAKAGKIQMAPDDKLKEDIPAYHHLMYHIEGIMGGQVYISDESSVWDFPDGFAEKLSKALGFPVGENDTFVDIVQKLKERTNPQ